MDRQRFILIVLILILLGGGYYYYKVYNVAPTPEGESKVIAEADTRLNEIRPIADVQLDLSLFNNPFFLSLQPVFPATTSAALPGRLNPFTPY